MICRHPTGCYVHWALAFIKETSMKNLTRQQLLKLTANQATLIRDMRATLKSHGNAGDWLAENAKLRKRITDLSCFTAVRNKEIFVVCAENVPMLPQQLRQLLSTFRKGYANNSRRRV